MKRGDKLEQKSRLLRVYLSASDEAKINIYFNSNPNLKRMHIIRDWIINGIKGANNDKSKL